MKLKSAFVILLTLFALNAGAQTAFNVINSFTLEDVDSVSVWTPEAKALITQNGSYFIIEEVKGEVEVVISAKGMKPYGTSLYITKSAPARTIGLEPLDSMLQVYRDQYPFYSRKNKAEADSLAKKETDKIYSYVDKVAEFPGGVTAMHKFLSERLEYPERAYELQINGKVYLQFVVSAQGDISNVSVLKSANLLMDSEAVRVVKMMPQWSPGEVNGKLVNSTFNLPVSFKCCM